MNLHRHLSLGRAYAMEGDSTKARTDYQDFLTLWKDADPDIPILKEAKVREAKVSDEPCGSISDCLVG
jgi:eukaryotic-like serine/threonine-protein kinase